MMPYALTPIGPMPINKIKEGTLVYVPVWEDDEPVKLFPGSITQIEPFDSELLEIGGIIIPAHCAIATQNGVWIEAKDIKKGDEILAWRPEDGVPAPREIPHAPFVTNAKCNIGFSGVVILGQPDGPWIAGRF